MRTILGAIVLSAAASTAHAQTRSQVYGSSITQQTMTAYVRADGGMTTYDSEAAGSKETKASATYSLGGWVGESRVAGFSITSSEQKVPFELNQSKVETAFHDVRALVRLGWLMPSVGVSLSEIEVENGGEKTVSLYATGVNAGLGLAIPLYSRIVVYGDGTVVKTSKDYDKIDDTTELGDRQEIDGGVSFDVTDRMIDFLIGYHVRNYSITTADTSYDEKSQGAYAGLRIGLYF